MVRTAAAQVRLCATSTKGGKADDAARASWRKSTNLGAFGSKSTRGSGVSLMGGKRRGQGALTPAEREALAAGKFEDSGVDDELEAGDVLMEVLAEDHRFQRNRLEFLIDDGVKADERGNDEKDKALPPPSGPRVAHRQYLTHSGVGVGTIYERQAAAAKQRLERAQSHAFDYQMPEEARKQREHEKRSRARLREHDVIENRIQVSGITPFLVRPFLYSFSFDRYMYAQEAMATGAFDDLPGQGKPLISNENPFEAMSGEALAHRVLKNAGCAPGWVEQGKEIRQALLNARSNLALEWAACVPKWPLPPSEETAEGAARSKGLPAARAGDGLQQGTADGALPEPPEYVRVPKLVSGGWRTIQQPVPLDVDGGARASVSAAAQGSPAGAPAAAAPAAAAEGRPADVQVNVQVNVQVSVQDCAESKAAARAAAEAERTAAAHQVRQAAESSQKAQEWAEAVETFHTELRVVNKLIDSYNLSVPAAWMGRQRLNAQNELLRALQEAPERSAVLKAERGAKLGGRASASSPSGGGVGSSSSGWAAMGSQPTFALHGGATFPSLWDSVSAVLFAR